MIDRIKRNEEVFYKFRMIGRASFVSEHFRQQLTLNGLDPFDFIYVKDDSLISSSSRITTYVRNLVTHHKV